MENKKNFIKLIILLSFFVLVNKIFINKNVTIAIDPGHGGEDPGTIGKSGVHEKDIALDISKNLRKQLRYRGYDVILTRESDERVSLEDRARIANENKADLFLSIHCNAMENNDDIKGVQVLYYPSLSGINETMAERLLFGIVEETAADDKNIVERENLVVLNQTNMKSFVLETGFLSNPEEAFLLGNKEYQELIVKGIVKTIEEFHKSSLL